MFVHPARRAALAGLLAFWSRGVEGHRVASLDYSNVASRLDVEADEQQESQANVSNCMYCKTQADCQIYRTMCSNCPACGGSAAPSRCPSFCTNAMDCLTHKRMCTLALCPDLCKGLNGGFPGGGGGGGGPNPKDVERLMAELDSLVGLDKVKDQMKELVAQVKFNMERERLGLPDIGGQSLHMSFLGNPGTGKTVVARIVGELMVAMGAIKPPEGHRHMSKDDIVVEVSRADLVAEYTGQTAPKVKKAVEKALGGVLFIDEAYALVQGDRDSFGNEAVDTLIKEMEDNRDKLIVILAGYQTEMATFLAANPGFKSRVAFHFAFPDYTCSELVQIGELLLKKKNVVIVPEGPPDNGSICIQPGGSGDVPTTCDWLGSAVRLRTGCCEEKDCGKEENRANGNGRTVRNILEASYRSMARRVLNQYTPAVLSQFSNQNRPRVSGEGKDARPDPPLQCGADFEAIRHGGPYTDLGNMGNGDVRCAFRLLEVPDLQEALGAGLKEQLSANCVAANKPVGVNVTEVLAKDGVLAAVDWERLHESLFGRRECSEPQEVLGQKEGSLAQLYDEEDGSLLEALSKVSSDEIEQLYLNGTLGTTGGCSRLLCRTRTECHLYPTACAACPICGGGGGGGGGGGYSGHCSPTLCTSTAYCYHQRCQGCAFCLGHGPAPAPPPQCHSACTSDWWCTAAPDRCSGCQICQGSGGGRITPGWGTLNNIECKVCDYAKRTLGNMGRLQLQRLDERATCRNFLVAEGASASQNMDLCLDNLGKVLLYMRLQGASFDCSRAVGAQCGPGGGSGGAGPGGGGYMGPGAGGPYLGDGRGPTSRPGSKVDELVRELNDLIGLEGVKGGINALRDAVEFDMWRKRFLGDEWSLLGQSFHMRFLGNPGTGKTVVARIVGKILVELEVVKKDEGGRRGGRPLGSRFGGGGRRGGDEEEELIFKEVSRADLVAGYVGQTAPKVQAAVKSAFGGVLFIDEAYALVQDERDSFGREAVDTLIKEIEDHRDKVIVIFAGYSKEMETFFEANPGFQSRVPFRFEFADYSCEQLGGIAGLQLKQQTIQMTDEAKQWVTDVVEAKTGCCSQESLDSGECAGATRDNGNGRAVRNILESALRSMSVRAVAATQSSQPSTELVTQLKDSDVAAVGGELISDALRATCKAAQEAVPDLEKLCTGVRILSVPKYADALEQARSTCAGTTKMLEGLKAASDAVGNAMDIRIADPKIADLFTDLDEKVGLVTVKRTMRELYTTVQFAQLRKQAGMEPLKSQSFHMRFLGNPGTGKTVVARIVGKLLVGLGAIEKPKKSNNDWLWGGSGRGGDKDDDEPIFNEVSRSDLVAEYVGQTANKTQHWIKESLGGVFFLDEAYALVQGDRDSFGQEAVDTLIKEMEDKRKQVIVICAGYAKEMEEFFDSNPGFRSRVPFTFFFEDYTCSELSQIGHLQLEKKKLTLPKDLTTYDQSIRFSTGCCDRLEDCEESKDKGNGRAVRNAVEAAIRAMARRLADDKGQPDKAKYSTMTEADFRTVTQQMIESRLMVPCGSNGELQKLTNSVGRAELGVLEDLPGTQSELLARVQRLSEETRLVNKMQGLDESSVTQGVQCKSRMENMTNTIKNKLDKVCEEKDGILTVIRDSLEAEEVAQNVQMYANILGRAVADQGFMRELLRAAWTEQELQGEGIPDLEKKCDARVEALRGSNFGVPFDFVTR